MMVYHIKIGMDIPFGKPSDPGEVNFYLAKSGLTASVWSEAMGGISECIFVDTFQNHFHNLLYQFIIAGLNTERTEFPILFGDIGTAGRFWEIGVVLHAVDDFIDSDEVHAVKCLSINTGTHVTWF